VVKFTRSNSPRTRVLLFAVPRTQSAFHPHARWNAVRSRDAAANVIETQEHKGEFKEP